MDASFDLLQLQGTLGYYFNQAALLEEALRHSSYVNEQVGTDLKDNERLEFLGDAVLNLAIGRLLMEAYPQWREGDLSRFRANIVNETQLAEIARTLDLGGYLFLGKGEAQTGGQEKNSILADAMEAVIAAIYLDSDFGSAFAFIANHFGELVANAPELNSGQDYKSRLQEAVQGRTRETPRYQVVEETGPDHDKTFGVMVTIGDMQTRGVGKSKKLAEQDAARNALALMDIS